MGTRTVLLNIVIKEIEVGKANIEKNKHPDAPATLNESTISIGATIAVRFESQ